jgi:hypothetical protein
MTTRSGPELLVDVPLDNIVDPVWALSFVLSEIAPATAWVAFPVRSVRRPPTDVLLAPLARVMFVPTSSLLVPTEIPTKSFDSIRVNPERLSEDPVAKLIPPLPKRCKSPFEDARVTLPVGRCFIPFPLAMVTPAPTSPTIRPGATTIGAGDSFVAPDETRMPSVLLKTMAPEFPDEALPVDMSIEPDESTAELAERICTAPL